MLPYFIEDFGNPSSIYEVARRSKQAVDESRQKIADLLWILVKYILLVEELNPITGQ